MLYHATMPRDNVFSVPRGAVGGVGAAGLGGAGGARSFRPYLMVKKLCTSSSSWRDSARFQVMNSATPYADHS